MFFFYIFFFCFFFFFFTTIILCSKHITCSLVGVENNFWPKIFKSERRKEEG